jgi:quercetin dioxygenase-like cupin family protein
MAIKVTAVEAQPDTVANASVRRYVRRDGPSGIGVGVTTFAPLAPGVEPTSIWEAHDVPEIHYVLAGRGVLYEEGEEIALETGDVVITPSGARHVLWGASHDEPLTTVYAAVSRTPSA